MKFNLFTFPAFLFFLVMLFCNNVKSQDLPANQFHFKSGNDLIYYSYAPNKEANTTEIVFEIYGADLKKKDTKKVTVKDIAAKVIYLTNIAYNDGRFVFLQIYLKTKAMGSTGLMLTVESDFSIRSQKKYPEEIESFNTPKEDFFNREVIPYLPLDHTTLNLNSFLVESQLDYYTPTAGMIYLLKEENNTVYNLDFSNTKKSIGPNSKLYYFEPVTNGYKKQWSVDISEEIIVNYRVYCFGDFVFLYTSYIPEGQKLLSSSLQYKIRRIDKRTGQIQFECELEKKTDFELMLSNVYFDESDQSLYFTGNYYSNLDMSKWIFKKGALSMLFWGKINAAGKITTKTIELESWLSQESGITFKGLVFARIASFEKMKDGSFFLGGSLFTSNHDVYDGEDSYSFMPIGIIHIRISSSLEEISKTPLFMTKGKLLSIYNIANQDNIRQLLMVTPETDRKLGINCFWNKETETLILSQYYSNENPTVTETYRIALYVAKFENGKQVLFKPIAEVKSGALVEFDKTYMLNEKEIMYVADMNPLKPLTVKKIE